MERNKNDNDILSTVIGIGFIVIVAAFIFFTIATLLELNTNFVYKVPSQEATQQNQNGTEKKPVIGIKSNTTIS
jgi:hypothetical protein